MSRNDIGRLVRLDSLDEPTKREVLAMPYPQEWSVIPESEQRQIEQERREKWARAMQAVHREPRTAVPPPQWLTGLMVVVLSLVLLGGIWLADWLMGRDAAVAGVCSAALVALSFWLACKSGEPDDKSL